LDDLEEAEVGGGGGGGCFVVCHQASAVPGLTVGG